jgi:hypothetical protein
VGGEVIIISANILCASLKVFAEAVKMASSTYASIDSQVCWEFLECQHCNIDKVPWRVGPCPIPLSSMMVSNVWSLNQRIVF